MRKGDENEKNTYSFTSMSKIKPTKIFLQKNIFCHQYKVTTNMPNQSCFNIEKLQTEKLYGKIPKTFLITRFSF